MVDSTTEVSMFQKKYFEFANDLIQTFPEYSKEINEAKSLSDTVKLLQFKDQIKVANAFGSVNDAEADTKTNPKYVLPGVVITDDVWNVLSDGTQKAIWEYLRVLSICCLMESEFTDDSSSDWMNHLMGGAMNDIMKEMKGKLESSDFQDLIKKFMNVFKSKSDSQTETQSETKSETQSETSGFEKLFENGFPQIPEKFLKGQMAKLAQEIVKDITPEDLGITPEMMDECEKSPSRSFDILFKVFGSNPAIIQKTVHKIGKRLQQKIVSGAIRPEEIAREAEELMKEFSENSQFVDMMEGIKSAFGFENFNLAKAAGRESSARLSLVKERLKKKASEKEAKRTSSNNTIILPTTDASKTRSDAILTSLIKEEMVERTKNISKRKPVSGKK